MCYKNKSKNHVEVFQYSKHPFLLSPGHIEDVLSTSMENGLNSEEAEKRLLKYGANSLNNEGGVSVIAVLLRQAANAMTLVRIISNIFF
uniref:Calcium transporting ATPase (Atp), putative n=1 Tax=Pneumocystis carinii TaxID=4754 RepID=Q6AHS8_PNECA|nr:calcium transporting ATPase (Atp), putative [Pneumocystis carinii]